MIPRPSPQDFSPWRAPSLDLVVALQPICTTTISHGQRQAGTLVTVYSSTAHQISHLVFTVPLRTPNIRHLSLTLYMAFGDAGLKYKPYLFDIQALQALGPVLRRLHTINIFVMPSPELQFPRDSRDRRYGSNYFNHGATKPEFMDAASPKVPELGKLMLGNEEAAGEYVGWKHQSMFFSSRRLKMRQRIRV